VAGVENVECQEVLKDPEWAGRLTDDDRWALSPLFWAHVAAARTTR
jgi:hypothetical protein